MTEALLLTAEDCHLCARARSVLRRLEREGGISLREVPLASPEGRRLAMAARAAFPPVLFLDGAPFCYGRVSERRLRAALRRSSD